MTQFDSTTYMLLCIYTIPNERPVNEKTGIGHYAVSTYVYKNCTWKGAHQ